MFQISTRPLPEAVLTATARREPIGLAATKLGKPSEPPVGSVRTRLPVLVSNTGVTPLTRARDREPAVRGEGQ